ncbi:hypothetical protein KBC03_04550 [Patescibacteria group bacterium]|nr:hypothetical protein [Patescibacteria group bacterium]
MTHYNENNKVVTVLRTRESRGYVFDGKYCLVCELTEQNQITRVVRNAMYVETRHIQKEQLIVVLPEPFIQYYPGNWCFMQLGAARGRVHLVVQRRTHSVTLSLMPLIVGGEKQTKEVEIVDMESAIKPFHLPGGASMPPKCTLEKYMELIHPTRILYDNKAQNKQLIL